jgi:prepilin peptidase CpaA
MSELALLHGAVLLVTGVAAVTDLRSGQIPNWLTLPAIAIAFVAHLATAGSAGAIYSALGLLMAGLFPLVLFWRGAMGGGDVKLFAAVGAALGPTGALEAELGSFFVAGLFAMLMMTWRGTLFRTAKSAVAIAFRAGGGSGDRPELDEELARPMRIGLAVFVGTAISLFVPALGALP